MIPFGLRNCGLMVCFVAIVLLLGVAFAAPNPTTAPIPSMWLSNWKNMILTWAGPRDNINQESPERYVGATGLHIASDWEKNFLAQDSFVLRVGENSYPNPFEWDGVWYLKTDGKWVMEINTYSKKPLDFKLTVTYVLPPEEEFYSITYEVSDPEGRNIEMMSYMSLTSPNPEVVYHADFDEDSKSYYVDLSNSTYGYTFGTSYYEDPQQWEVGCVGYFSDALNQYAACRRIACNKKITCDKPSIAYLWTGTGSLTTHAVRTMQTSKPGALGIMKHALSKTPEEWDNVASKKYEAWLNQAKPVTASAELTEFYKISLLFLKNGINPTLGTIVASFHPKYGYKVWSRDATFAAMILDAAGYAEEAVGYYKWAAQAELDWEGKFHTCYNVWTGAPVGFVEPQLDSTGLYPLAIMYSVYNSKSRYPLTSAVKERLGRIHDYYMNHRGSDNKLAPSDYSIWEESSSPTTGEGLPTGYFAFSQAMSYAGLKSLGKLWAYLSSDYKSAEANTRAREIQDVVTGNHTRYWVSNEDGEFFARQLWSDTMDTERVPDASTSALLWTGMVPRDDDKYMKHLNTLKRALTRDDFGIARYKHDLFFYGSKFNPGGREVEHEMPPWGVVTMFTSWCEDEKQMASRLQWMYDRSAAHGMPVGEAVDGDNRNNFVWSSAPDLYEHAGVFAWTQLIYNKQAIVPNPDNLVL